MRKLFSFCLVGALGTVINISIYILMVRYFSIGLDISAIVAFVVAVTNNYIVNHCWTFFLENNGGPINKIQFIYYFAGNIFGLVINLIVLNTIVFFAGSNYYLIGQLTGIACGVIFNFSYANKVVFNRQTFKYTIAK